MQYLSNKSLWLSRRIERVGGHGQIRVTTDRGDAAARGEQTSTKINLTVKITHSLMSIIGFFLTILYLSKKE